MRVISQGGEIDIPYEIAAFRVFDRTIRMNMCEYTGADTVVAEYRSHEDAVVVMGWMRDTYKEFIKEHTNSNIHQSHAVFKFPDEDEVRI